MSSQPSWPNADDYRQALSRFHEVIGDEELRGCQPVLNARRKPMLWSGNFAAVFRIRSAAAGKEWALKCFTRPVPERQERYQEISACLEKLRLRFTVDFQYLERGVLVHGEWFPALKMQWVEGLTLNQFVEEHLERPRNLKMLLDLWVKLAARLREAKIAHADLQHGNVLLVPQDHGALALRLIDYDGMFVPALAGTRSSEAGHENFQHPRRLDHGTFCADVDRFSHLVIYTAVHCLTHGRRKLWDRFKSGDNLLFRASDFRDPGGSPLFHELWQAGDGDARALVGRLALACGQPLEASPWVDELIPNGRIQRLSRSEEVAVTALLAAGRATAAAIATSPAPLPLGPAGEGRGEATWPSAGTAPSVLGTQYSVPSTRPAPPTAALVETERVGTAGTQPMRAAIAPRGRLRRAAAAPFAALDRRMARLAGKDNNLLRLFLDAAAAVCLVVMLGLVGNVAWSHFSASRTPHAPREGRAEGPSARPTVPTLKEISLDLAPGVKLEMVLIAAGEFLMGSPASDNNAGSDEKPQHRVRITKSFYLGKYEVTQEQWEAVMGNNPSNFKGAKNPVETVSWDDCQQFIAKLNAKSRPGGGQFQLPTEAQWEYACRAGSTTRYCFGDDESGLGEYAWYGGNSGGKTHPVGEKKVNAWGLYDMHGNVWEWCADGYESSNRVYRGGYWIGDARGCRSANRINTSFYSIGRLGLRVSLVPADAGERPELARPVRLKPLPPQAVEAGKRVTVRVSAEDARAWQGKLGYSLEEGSPADSVIDPQTGEFSWTPAPDQTPATYHVTVLVHAPDGRSDRGVLRITVTPSLPLPPSKPLLPGQKELAVDLGNGVTLELVLIPAGEFLMGSPASDDNAQSDEKPQHRVRISKSFYLGKYLVTQAQWEAVMGNNPSNFKGPKNPVETVSWDDCQQFIAKLNAKPGLGGGKFQLPTEAQWEYACRAGSTTRYCFGDDESGLGEYAWYGGNSGRKTHPVGEKKPNAWGLYDLHGNVREWCADGYESGYYGKSPTDDPTGPATGSYRVFRGGRWDLDARICRSAIRGNRSPGARSIGLGLRVSLVPADR